MQRALLVKAAVEEAVRHAVPSDGCAGGADGVEGGGDGDAAAPGEAATAAAGGGGEGGGQGRGRQRAGTSFPEEVIAKVRLYTFVAVLSNTAVRIWHSRSGGRKGEVALACPSLPVGCSRLLVTFRFYFALLHPVIPSSPFATRKRSRLPTTYIVPPPVSGLWLPCRSAVTRSPSHLRVAAGQVPLLVADLHAALGRGVSTGEAKAWVRALDRLGEGLTREKLLEACLVSKLCPAQGAASQPSTCRGTRP